MRPTRMRSSFFCPIASIARLLDAAPRLKIVANVAVGYDNLDVRHAAQKGVICTNTPDVLTDATADLTWALILDVTRRVSEGDRLARAGNWKGWTFEFMLGSGLQGKQLGIVGGGRIGRAVAERARGFGMKVAVTSRRDPGWPDAEFMPLDRLLATSDVVSLHVPLSPETRRLIDQPALARMKRTAFLINTTRGAVVDESALAWALKEHMIAGAGARRVRERAGDQRRSCSNARERRAVATPRKRNTRDPNRDGRSRRFECARCLERPAAADANRREDLTIRTRIRKPQSAIRNSRPPGRVCHARAGARH